MKLQFDQIVEHSDADLILRTLEQHLREVSLETVRTKDELIVYGLGPSFRTMNRNDKTIVRATSQPGATTLHTEANFLASALAGDVAQDEIVRSKIERAFESLKNELGNGGAPRPIAVRATQTATPVLPSPAVEALPTIAKVGAPATIKVEENSRIPIDHTSDRPQKTFIEAKPAPQPEAKPEPQPNLKIEAKPEPRIEPKPTPKIDAPVLTTPRRSAPVPAALTMEAVPIKKGRSAILLVLPLLILVLAAAFYLLQHHHASENLFAAEPEEHTASASTESKALVPAPAAAPSVSAANSEPPTPAAMPTDIKAWVQAWAAAMSSQDVQAQLSFYATPLDRYFLASDVSRESLLKDKQAEIDDRKGTWTLKAEDVIVEKQTPTKAVVYLNKHIIVQLPSSAIREERIKGQLKLKLVDGVWKITSERTIG